MIENDACQSFHKEDDITEVITNYYQDLFTSSPTNRVAIVEKALSPIISPETNERLTAVPTPEEVRASMFSIHPDKTPGSDGFSASFFQSNWKTVEPSITAEIQEVFSTGQLPRDVNHMHIRLIPKI